MKNNEINRISNIEFIPVRFQKGLIGFVSFVWDNSLYLSSIGVKVKPDGDIYLLCPSKKFKEKNIQYFYPINSASYNEMIDAIIPVIHEFLNNQNNEEEKGE